MKNKNIEEIILKFKNLIANTEFENNLYIYGGYLRDLYYNDFSNDLDLILISNTDQNIFLNLISENLNIGYLNKTDVNTFLLKINNINIDLKILTNLNNLSIYDIFKIDNQYDYTINSLVKNISTDEIIEVIDDAQNNLKDRIIKCVKDLNIIFLNSPIRIFRLIRFYSKFNIKIPLSILKYIKKNSYLINFIDRDRLINEYISIIKGRNSRNAIKLLNILNINPTDINRSPVFFGEGWYELEPGKEPNRVVSGKKYKWSKINPEFFIGKNVEILKINFKKHPSIKNDILKYYYNNDSSKIYKIFMNDGNNEILFNVNNNSKLNIIVDTFTPSKVENVNDNRELGICMTDCKIYGHDGCTFFSKTIDLEQIPYILNNLNE